jgi:protein AroM
VQRRLEELEALDVTMTVVLCTGAFEGLTTSRPLVQPDRVLRGILAGVRFPGRLGVLTPSPRHVEQTEARWRAYGFDPIVVAASPYEEAGSAAAIADAFRAAGVGLLLLDCMGFRRATREALQEALGVPIVVANLMVARVVAEMLGG